MKPHLPLSGTIFAARWTYRLAYRSQQDSPMECSHAWQARLYQRPGEDYRYLDWLPPLWPKGMRKATYQRLAAQLESTMELHEDIFMIGAARISARPKGR